MRSATQQLTKGSYSPPLPLCTTFTTWFSKFSQRWNLPLQNTELELAVRLSLANGEKCMKSSCPNSEPRPWETWSTSAHLLAHLPSTQEQAWGSLRGWETVQEGPVICTITEKTIPDQPRSAEPPAWPTSGLRQSKRNRTFKMENQQDPSEQHKELC